MKVKRVKGYKHQLDLYSLRFGLVIDPLEIFVDNTFARQALVNQLALQDQFESATKCSVKLVTSSCIIEECKHLGSLFDGARTILEQFKVLTCRHPYNPAKSAPWCMKKRISRLSRSPKSGRSNLKLFGIATNDMIIQETARLISGVPIFYVAHNRFNLEPPSLLVSRLLEEKAKIAPEVSEHEHLAIKALSEKYGIPNESASVKKKRDPKQPNPLSCKRKSKITSDSQHRSSSNRKKRKRKRIHMTWAFRQVLYKLKKEMGAS